MADIGIKISDENENVSSVPIHDLQFDSELGTMRFIQSGQFYIDINHFDERPFFVVNHNLGYRPSCLLFGESRVKNATMQVQPLTVNATNNSWAVHIHENTLEIAFMMTESSILNGTGYYGRHYGYYYIIPKDIV